ncbi:MAG: hypothetical protein ACI9FZ_001025 [Bacteroidia bacterium]
MLNDAYNANPQKYKMAAPEILNKTKESLQRMQEFDTHTLPRSSDLGSSLQDTEYTKSGGGSARSIVELLTKAMMSADDK